MKILTVCLGNICRSPLAEGILKEKIKNHDLPWSVDSAGTGAWHVGELPDPRSIAVAQLHNIDITDQRARQFKAHDLDNYDLILAMDSSNYRNIIQMASTDEQKEKVYLVMNFVSPGMNENVPDPYYGNDGFQQVYDMLDAASDAIIKKYNQ